MCDYTRIDRFFCFCGKEEKYETQGYTKESLENMHAAVQKRLKMCAENESANINNGKKK